MVQLSITAAFVAIGYNSPKITNFANSNIGVMYTTMAVYVVCVILLGCYKKISRSVPINYILLFMLTAAMSYMT
jgi:FtsH-binding integral membrane protein